VTILEECWIEEVGPMSVVRPASAEEAGTVVRQAALENRPVFPLGGRTLLHVGLPPARAGLGLSVADLKDVVDHPARDMTITVGAGITLESLAQILQSEQQRLPVDIPHPERATLGGMVAANASGPRRYGYGTLRDYVIGISVITAEGRLARAGGRVVKNVAGYDLCKLYVGALGTLGVITQVTLKLKPLPEDSAFVSVGCETNTIETVLQNLAQSRTRPVCIELLNRLAIEQANPSLEQPLPQDPWVIVVGFEEKHDTVAWQVKQLLHELSQIRCQVAQTRSGDACAGMWKFLVESTDLEETGVTFKANLLPSRVASFCASAVERTPELQIQAHAGSGIVVGHLRDGTRLERTQGILSELLDAATAARGNLVLTRCPPAWKRTLPVWGRTRADSWLMRAVKEKLDPHAIFNPGRFIDGR
jgi:glycolate oxidase FAD binding subunit